MAHEDERSVRVPPRWFVRAAWRVHRALYRITAGRVGLWTTGSKRGWGALRLVTVGRRSGRKRAVNVGDLEGEPAWSLNLQAHPEATVHLANAPPRRVRARVAEGTERDRLWARWHSIEPDLDAYAALRSGPTAVIVLAPLPAT